MKILIFIAIIVAFFGSLKFSNAAIEKYGLKKNASAYRVKYLSKTIGIALIIFYLIILINFSGFEYSQISFFLSSIFAVLGVALFAQWSILSNITASFIIFFSFPYRVGDHIKIIDRDDDIHGIIEEITLFHVLIKREGELITYPNTLILQKGVIKTSKVNKLMKPVVDEFID